MSLLRTGSTTEIFGDVDIPFSQKLDAEIDAIFEKDEPYVSIAAAEKGVWKIEYPTEGHQQYFMDKVENWVEDQGCGYEYYDTHMKVWKK